jgi:hypothetical protein
MVLIIFGHVQGMEENRIPEGVLYMNLGTTRLRGRTRNRWQDEVRDDGRIVGGEGWLERVYNREEWKKILRTARNRQILHMSKERMNESYLVMSNNHEEPHYKQTFLPTFNLISQIPLEEFRNVLRIIDTVEQVHRLIELRHFPHLTSYRITLCSVPL